MVQRASKSSGMLNCLTCTKCLYGLYPGPKGGCLTAFDQVFAMTGGGPNNATTSLGLLVYNYAFKTTNSGYANAIAVILFFLIVVISIIQLRVSKKFEI